MGARPRIWSVLGNDQRLDGGAMFGNAPRALWSRWCEPDDAHRIRLACRALLLQEENGRLILFEAGIGVFFDPKMRARFGVEPAHHALLKNLSELGFQPGDIDVVVLSHLHFDHAGGLLMPWREDGLMTLAFPNASYVVGRDAWTRALNPHSRDRASFIPELQPLIESTGRLEVVDGEASDTLGQQYRLHYSHGHTPGLMLVEIPSEDGPILFCGDLIPGVPWVHLPITMGYDRFPELLIDEKAAILGELLQRGGRLFFTHDPEFAMGTLTQYERGRFSVSSKMEHPCAFTI